MALIAQGDMAAIRPTDWRQDALADLAGRLAPPSDFACTFAQNAFRRGLLWLSFVETGDHAGIRAAADDLAAYVADCRTWDGRVDTARPLVMVIARQAAACDRLDDCRAIAWGLLQAWHEIDPAPWPVTVATDPEAPFWSFCFAGMQLFVNVSTPLHVRRRSRNLGRHLTLVINPRERFDLVAGDTPEGHRTRARIRARAARQDGLPHSPLLGHYQRGDLEWVQYFLPDDNTAPAGRCPFRFHDRSVAGPGWETGPG